MVHETPSHLVLGDPASCAFLRGYFSALLGLLTLDAATGREPGPSHWRWRHLGRADFRSLEVESSFPRSPQTLASPRCYDPAPLQVRPSAPTGVTERLSWDREMGSCFFRASNLERSLPMGILGYLSKFVSLPALGGDLWCSLTTQTGRNKLPVCEQACCCSPT